MHYISLSKIALIVMGVLTPFSFCFGAAHSSTAAYRQAVAQGIFDTPSRTTTAATTTPTSSLPIPTEKKVTTPPKNWLCTLPDELVHTIREMLMGKQWVLFEELVLHKLSAPLAAQVCAGIIPLTPLFSNPLAINKKNTTHSLYGTVNIDNAQPPQRCRVILTNGEHQKSYVVDYARSLQNAYFSPDNSVIIVEYLNLSREKYWCLLDPCTLQPLHLTIWKSPNREATKLFFKDMNPQSRCQIKGTPFTYTEDGRFIASECSADLELCVVDLTAKKLMISLKIGLRANGHPLPFYPVPNTCVPQWLLNQGDCLTFVNYEQQARIGRLDLPSHCIVHGFANPKTMESIPCIAQNTSEEQREKAIILSDSTSTWLLLPKKRTEWPCILFEGVLSSALDRLYKSSVDNKEISVRDELARCLDSNQKLSILYQGSALTQFQNINPMLAQRYHSSCFVLTNSIKDLLHRYVSMETLDFALELLLISNDETLAKHIQNKLTIYYRDRKRSFRDGRHIQQDLCKQYPKLATSALKSFLETLVDEICDSYPRLPKVVISADTVASDIQELSRGNMDLDPPLKKWLVEFYTIRRKDFKCMREVREHLLTHFSCQNISRKILQDWLTAIKTALLLPELSLTLDQIGYAFSLTLDPKNRHIKAEITNQIAHLIIQYYTDTIKDYPDRIALEDDIETRFSLFTQLMPKQQERIKQKIYRRGNINSPQITMATLPDILTRVNTIKQMRIRRDIMNQVCNVLIHHYKTHEISFLDMVAVAEDIHQRFPMLVDSDYKLILRRIMEQTSIAKFRVTLETIGDDFNRAHNVKHLHTDIMSEFCRILVAHYNEHARYFIDMVAVAEDIHHRMPMLVGSDYQLILKQIAAQTSIPKIFPVTRATLNRAFTILHAYKSPGTRLHHAITALHTNTIQSHAHIQREILQTLITLYREERFKGYDMMRIKENLIQSFPAFSTLSVESQNDLLQCIARVLKYPPTSLRSQLRAGVTSSRPRALALAKALYKYRKDMAIIGLTSASLWIFLTQATSHIYSIPC